MKKKISVSSVAELRTVLRSHPTLRLEFLAGLAKLLREHDIDVEPAVLSGLTVSNGEAPVMQSQANGVRLSKPPGGTPKPAPGGTPKPAPGGTPKPAPGGTPKPAPGGTPKPAPGGTPKPAPGGTPKPAPGGTPKPAPGG